MTRDEVAEWVDTPGFPRPVKGKWQRKEVEWWLTCQRLTEILVEWNRVTRQHARPMRVQWWT